MKYYIDEHTQQDFAFYTPKMWKRIKRIQNTKAFFKGMLLGWVVLLYLLVILLILKV